MCTIGHGQMRVQACSMLMFMLVCEKFANKKNEAKRARERTQFILNSWGTK